jgi:purine-binding chemotaxis protein CheW
LSIENEILDYEDTQKNKFLIFMINNESYAIRIECVIEIIKVVEITKVPDLPDYVKGIINLRGNVIPVMDARLRFKQEEKPYDDRTCTIVIDIDGTFFGLIVDSVKEVAEIEEGNISLPPEAIKPEGGSSGFIEGIGKVKNDIWLVVDSAKLINKTDSFQI